MQLIRTFSRSVYSGSSRWRLRHPSCSTFGCRARRRVCGAMAKRGVEAQGQTSDAPSRKLSRRSGKTSTSTVKQLRGQNVAARARISSKPRSCKLTAKSQGQSALRHHNLKQSPQWIYEMFTANAARSRTGSRNCMSCRSTAPVAAISGPTSSACC